MSGRVVETTVRRIPVELGLDLRGGTHIALEIDESQMRVEDCAEAIGRTERVIRGRMSEFGTTEPVVQIAGEGRLIVELPGEHDLERARSIVQRTAFQELRLVDPRHRSDALAAVLEGATGEPGIPIRGEIPGEYHVPEGLVDRVREALDRSVARRALPRSLEVRWGTRPRTVGGWEYRPFYVVESRALVTGEKLVGATAARDPMTGLRTSALAVAFVVLVMAEPTQSFGSDRAFLVCTRLEQAAPPAGDATRTRAVAEHARHALDAALGADAYELVRTEGVGPKVGSELQTKAALAVATSFATTLAYLAARFDRRFGLAAVVATAHDVLATLAFISFLDPEVSLVTVAGVLTVLGYSLNDTIVIFDPVRENLLTSSGRGLREVLNTSINETLPRTVLTACTTLVAAVLLATLAGPVVRPLGLVMSFGIVVGTLSSIFVASPALLRLSGWAERREGPDEVGVVG